MRYTLKDIIDLFVQKSKLPQKKAELFAKAFFKTIVEGLEQDSLTKVKNFGTFKIVAVSDRQSVDVNTGRPVLISGHKKVTFTPDEKFKSIVNRPFSQFETTILNEETKTEELELVATPELPTAAEEETQKTPSSEVSETEHVVHADATNSNNTEEETLTKATTPQEAAAQNEKTNSNEEKTASESSSTVHSAVSQQVGIMQTQSISADAPQPYDTTLEPKNEPQAEDKDEQTEAQSIDVEATTTSDLSEKTNNNGRWKIATIVLGIILVIGAVFLIMKPSANESKGSKEQVMSTDSTQNIPSKTPEEAVAQSENSDGITIGENGKKLQIFDTQNPKDIVNNFEIVGDLDEYEIKFGDIVELIAKERYGNGYFIKYIYKHNNMKPYEHVSTGTVLKLPKLRRKN